MRLIVGALCSALVLTELVARFGQVLAATYPDMDIYHYWQGKLKIYPVAN